MACTNDTAKSFREPDKNKSSQKRERNDFFLFPTLNIKKTLNLSSIDTKPILEETADSHLTTAILRKIIDKEMNKRRRVLEAYHGQGKKLFLCTKTTSWSVENLVLYMINDKIPN